MTFQHGAPRQEPADDGLGRRPMTRRRWIDTGIVALLSVIAMLGFQPPFGGYWFLLAIAGGLIVGVGAALLGFHLRLNLLNTVLIAIAAYFALGTTFALPQSGFLGVLPTLTTLGSLAIGAVFSWRDVLTLQAPIEGPDHSLVLPYIATAIVVLACTILVLRWLPRHSASAGRAALVVLGPMALFLLTLITGTHTPFLAIVRALAFGLVALVWLGWRRDVPTVASPHARTQLWRRRVAGTAIVALAAAVVTGGAGLVAQHAIDQQRFVLRDEVTPPFDPFITDSPLAGFRQYTKLYNDTVLFSVNGMQPGDALRLATLDTYSGKKWEIVDPRLGVADAGTYNLVGRDVPQPSFLTSTSSRQIEVHVGGYSGIWLPTIGSPERLDLLAGAVTNKRSELRFNGQTGTGMVMGGVAKGDVYSVSADLQDRPLEGQLDNVPVATIQLPPSAPPPAALVERMQTFIAGETAPYAQLLAIEQAFRSQGYLSHGTANDMAPSRAGHGLDRMQELFDLRYMVGDSEQYASAMALMARELGYSARVVMGFAPEAITAGTPTDVKGGDVTAWVEVPFEGFGWVAFHPTPDQTDVPVNTTTQPQTKPKAQVRQPPQTQARPDELITAAEKPKDDDRGPGQLVLPWWAVALIIVVGVPLVAYVLPLLVFVLIRTLRRRRRHAGSADARVAGAWDEALDRLVELGFVVPDRETRARTAGAMHPELIPLAAQADRAVFGDVDPDEREIEGVWDEADRLVRGAGREAGFWRRTFARFRIAPKRTARPRRTRLRGDMTVERAELRNRALRSHGEDLPSAETIARIEAGGQS